MIRKVAILLLALVCLSLILVGQAWLSFGDDSQANGYRAGSVTEMKGTGEDAVEWKLSADRIVAQHDAQYVEAHGDCTLVKGENSLRADFIRYYRETQWVLLRGNVRAVWEGDFLECSEAEFDLYNKLGWLKNGKAFVAKPHVYVEAGYIRKHKGDTYSFKDAKVTACSGQKPDWSFSAQEGDISLDGKVKLWHSTFRIKDIPVAYAPYMAMPTGRKRTSGFLMPQVSNSDRLGFQINLPYYWAMDEEKDVTFYQNWMSDRGYMQGLEFRHTDDTNTQGLWRFDWLEDYQVADTQAQEDKMFRGDGLTRPNSDRWWLRSKFDGYLIDPDWRAVLDLDVISDQNYLREFRVGYSGYDESLEEFLEEFGRDIDPADSLTRTSTALVSRSWDNYGVAGQLQYTQDLRYWNGNNPGDRDPTVQKLPEIDFFAYKSTLAGPLEFQMDSSYDYFWRRYGTRGHRLDVKPSVSLPIKSDYVTVIPTAGIRQTFYGISEYENENANVNTDDKYRSRTLPTLGVTAFSEVSRVYSVGDELTATAANVGQERWTRIKHSVEPRVDYSWRPNSRREYSLPRFDEQDRLESKNEVTYSLTNVLDRREDKVKLVPRAEGGSEPVLLSNYLDFFRFRLQQTYDRDEATRNDMLSVYDRRPFSDVLAEFIIRPREWISLTSRTWLSPYEGSVTEHEHLVTLMREDLGSVWFGYDYLDTIDEYDRRRSESYQVIRFGGRAQVTDQLSLGADLRFDLDAERDLEKTLSVMWQDECWSMEMYYSLTDTDSSVGVRFDLFQF